MSLYFINRGLWVPTSDTRCDLALTWFIRYIYYRNLQFLNYVIMIKTKALSPHAYMTFAEFGYPVKDLWFISPQGM